MPDDALDVDAALAHYREHGYAHLPNVIGDAQLAALRERADDLMLGRITIDGLFFQHEAETGRYEDLPWGEGYVGPSLRYRKLEKLERDDRFRALIEHALFERIVRAAISGPIVIYRAVLFSKSSDRSSALPWHQDGGSFWGLDREPELQIWTALDDAGRDAGCVEVVPQSHRGGLVTKLGGVIPEPFLERGEAEARAVPLPVRAGDVLLIHNHVWHRSFPNRSAKPRRAFTVCYMSAATRCLRKRRTPRQFVPVWND